MFNKKQDENSPKKNSTFTKELVNDLQISTSIDKSMKKVGTILTEAARQNSTWVVAEGYSLPYIGLAMIDGAKTVTEAYDLRDYSKEIVNISEEKLVDNLTVSKEVTKNTVRKGIINIFCRDIAPAVTNMVIRSKVNFDTDIKKALYAANIPGLLGLGLAEGTDKLLVSHELKKYQKANDEDKIVGNLYYQGKIDGKYAKDKVDDLKTKIATSGITSGVTGIFAFLVSRSDKKNKENNIPTFDANDPNNEGKTVTISIFTETDGESEKKTSPSTDKNKPTNKVVGNVSKSDKK